MDKTASQNEKFLTPAEEKIIREQIVKNSKVIDWMISRIDLLINKEGHKNDSEIVLSFRKKLVLLMEENDTFRKVFWKHIQQSEISWTDGTRDAYRYLALRARARGNSAFTSLSGSYEIGTCL